MTIKDNSVTINAKWGELDTVFNWCSEHCAGSWDLAEIVEPAGYTGGKYQFTFDNDGDLILFELRWG